MKFPDIENGKVPDNKILKYLLIFRKIMEGRRRNSFFLSATHLGTGNILPVI